MTCFGHLYDNLQGGENKNTITIIMCRNQPTVKRSYKSLSKTRLKEGNINQYKILDDKQLLYMKYSAVDNRQTKYM